MCQVSPRLRKAELSPLSYIVTGHFFRQLILPRESPKQLHRHAVGNTAPLSQPPLRKIGLKQVVKGKCFHSSSFPSISSMKGLSNTSPPRCIRSSLPTRYPESVLDFLFGPTTFTLRSEEHTSELQ